MHHTTSIYTYTSTYIHTYNHYTPLYYTKSLNNNKLGDAAGKAIAEGLKVNTSIEDIK